jgi:hypothetical protein
MSATTADCHGVGRPCDNQHSSGRCSATHIPFRSTDIFRWIGSRQNLWATLEVASTSSCLSAVAFPRFCVTNFLNLTPVYGHNTNMRLAGIWPPLPIVIRNAMFLPMPEDYASDAAIVRHNRVNKDCARPRMVGVATSGLSDAGEISRAGPSRALSCFC